MPNLYRSGGITFNGFSVDNSKRNGYKLTEVTKPVKAGQNYSSKYLPSRSKTIYGKNGYEDILVSVIVSISAKDYRERLTKIAKIVDAWEGRHELQLKGSRLHYIGEILGEITPDEQGFYTLLTFNFVCEPFLYGDEVISILEQSQTITYNGYKVFPKFVVNGNVTISNGEDSFSISTNGESVVIDGENMIVYSASTEKNKMSIFHGDFISLEEGINTITMSGSGTVSMSYIGKFLYDRGDLDE